MEISLHPGVYRFIFQSNTVTNQNPKIKWALKNGNVGVITMTKDVNDNAKKYLVPLVSDSWIVIGTIANARLDIKSLVKREPLYASKTFDELTSLNLNSFGYYDNVVRVETTSTLYIDKSHFEKLLCVVTTWAWTQAGVGSYERQKTL